MENTKDLESQLKQLLKFLEGNCSVIILMIAKRHMNRSFNLISLEIENVCQLSRLKEAGRECLLKVLQKNYLKNVQKSVNLDKMSHKL